MTCPVCRNTITGLSCFACAMNKAREAAFARQQQWLPSILANRMDVLVARTKHDAFHIVLSGMRERTWCWADTKDMKLKPLPWYEAEAQPLCQKCREAFVAATKEVPA